MMINSQKISNDLQNGKIDDAQSTALRLPVEQRLAKFIEIANALLTSGKKEPAGQLLERAWNMIPARAGNKEKGSGLQNVLGTDRFEIPSPSII